MADEVIRRTVAALEGDQPAVCPECGQILPGKDRPGHLAAAHGYLEIAGVLLPRPEALHHLWDRVFLAGDAEAHELIAHLLAGRPGTGAEASYRGALETELLRRADALFAARWQNVPRLVQCLRQSVTARPHFRSLLRAADPRVRDVGRELLLPDACEQLAEAGTSAAQVRRWLDRLCPLEAVDEKIRLGRRLPQFGADDAAVAACLQELENERPVACPECGARVPGSQLDVHLRTSHHIFQVGGARRSLKEALVILLTQVCSPEPDAEAWSALETLVRDEYGEQAESFLAASLSQALKSVAEDQDEAITAVAQTITVGGCSSRLITLLAANPEPAGRQLALTLAARLRGSLDDTVVTALRPLLLDTRLSEESQLAAAAALLRTTGSEGLAAREVLGALTAGLQRVQAIERLRKLEQLTGKVRAVTEFHARLEDLVRMRCPRCPTQLRRRDMVEHLWTEHGLVLDGRRVREPWQVVEDWIEEYRQTGDGDLLARCRELGPQLHPERGLLHVNRLLLARGVADDEARDSLLAEAEQRQATLCPRCYAIVPVPQHLAPFPLSAGHGRLAARGYRVEVVRRGLVPRLELETPSGLREQSPVRGERLTLRGATLVLVGPLVVAALVLAVVLPPDDAPLVVVMLFLTLALGFGLAVRRLWREPPDALDRVVDYAWTRLVPRLHADSFSLEDSGFVAGLALTSCAHGRPEVRARALERILRLTENAVTAGAARHLGALRRLAIADAAAAGQDPVPLVVSEVGPCFDGKLSLAFAESLLAGWDGDFWTPRERARLRALLCDRAFEAGFEVQDLRELEATAPALDALIRGSDVRGLAGLRLLWSMRSQRPWERCGPASTAFEVAANAQASTRLAKYPDLLLQQDVAASAPDAAGGRLPAVSILLCGRGVVLDDTLFTEAPRNVEIVARHTAAGDGFEMVLDERRLWFPSDPENLLRRLERWLRFYFKDFLPQLAAVYNWKSPDMAASLRTHEMLECPECGHVLLSRVGEVGVSLHEAG